MSWNRNHKELFLKTLINIFNDSFITNMRPESRRIHTVRRRGNLSPVISVIWWEIMIRTVVAALKYEPVWHQLHVLGLWTKPSISTQLWHFFSDIFQKTFILFFISQNQIETQIYDPNVQDYYLKLLSWPRLQSLKGNIPGWIKVKYKCFYSCTLCMHYFMFYYLTAVTVLSSHSSDFDFELLLVTKRLWDGKKKNNSSNVLDVFNIKEWKH